MVHDITLYEKYLSITKLHIFASFPNKSKKNYLKFYFLANFQALLPNLITKPKHLLQLSGALINFAVNIFRYDKG